jgi:hypothetical protein
MQTNIAYWRRELEILERLLASAEHRTYRQCSARGCQDITDGVIARRRANAENIRRWLAEQDREVDNDGCRYMLGRVV